MNEQVNYAKIQRIQDNLDNLIIGTFGTGFVTDAMLNESGIKSTVAQHTSDLEDIMSQPTRIGAETTDTQAIQRLIDADKIVRINSNLTIDNSIVLKTSSRIIGTGRDKCSITMTDDTKFAFILDTVKQAGSYDITVSLYISDIGIVAKNGFRINQKETNLTEFMKMGVLKGIIFERIKMTGKYDIADDSNYQTTVLPTLSELQSYGVGFQLTKIFDSCIRDCEIQYYGLGLDLLGCDINKFNNNRFAYNGRHYHHTRIGTFGSQNRIVDCDILANKRTGAVYLDTTNFEILDNNYFECYDNSAKYIISNNDKGTSIINNRFDDSGLGTAIPLMTLSPAWGLNVTENRFNPSSNSVLPIVEVLTTNYIYTHRGFGIWLNNDSKFPVPTVPLLKTKQLDINIFKEDNILDIDGTTASAGYPFTPSTTNAYATLTFTGVVADGQTVTIGSEIYEFKTSGNATAGRIKVDVSGGVTADLAVTALISAINGNANSLVTSSAGTGTSVVVTSKTSGTNSNSINLSESCTNATWNNYTLIGGRWVVKNQGSSAYIFLKPKTKTTTQYKIVFTIKPTSGRTTFFTNIYVNHSGGTKLFGNNLTVTDNGLFQSVSTTVTVTSADMQLLNNLLVEVVPSHGEFAEIEVSPIFP